MAVHCAPLSGLAVASSTSSNEIIKLRRSCDQCQGIKVRCSRDKPCKRCTRRRLECVYSPIRRIGRPKKQTSDDAASSRDDGEGDGNSGEHDNDESTSREAMLLSPSNSTNQGGSAAASNQYDPRISHASSRVTDVGTGESNHPSLGTQCQSNVILPPNSNDALFRSVVNTWIPDHQLSASTHVRPDIHTAATNAGSSPHQGNIPVTATSTYTGKKQEQPDCYTAILAQTARLEQALARTVSPPPIDLILEAERDFNAIHHRLFECTGHIMPLSPESNDSQPPFPPLTSACSDTCLASERPVLLGLALLAERVVGMLEDMFRMAARSAQTVDKASDFVWAGSPGTSSLSARRINRSLRNVMGKPCASVGLDSYRPLCVEDFDVQGQAKSDAMGRILKLRAKRIFEALDSARQAEPRAKQGREQSLGGPLDWGGSSKVFEEMTRTLLDDLIRRTESLQGALVLL